MINYIVCLKWGNKYGPEYVNTLEQMVRRYCTLPFEFVCFTENPTGLNHTVKVMPLPTSYGVNGWWHKPLLFNPSLPLQDPQGTILYIDLDVIIFRSIDNLFTYKPGEFCVIRDFNRCNNPAWNKFNSSVVRWNIGQHPQIYRDFIKDPSSPVRRFHGDQDWLFAQVKREESLLWCVIKTALKILSLQACLKYILKHLLLCFTVTLNLNIARIPGVRRIGNELQHSKYVRNTCATIRF
jgi:hypothetical protein